MKKLSAPANTSLNRAKIAKDSEFYTRAEDIEREIISSGCYDGCFRGKTVMCNCNDTGKSGFKRFFVGAFDLLGLKQLIVLSYGADAMVTFYDGDHSESFPLIGNGDFRSKESVELLRHADIIVTNPPFFLFKEFLQMLIENDKQFVIVGNVVSKLTCKDIFPLYMNGEVKFGSSRIKTFQTPEGARSFGSVGWYTNIGVHKDPEPLTLAEKYFGNELSYPRYDNYDAISIDRIRNIPGDFYGEMGVPSSYLPLHNPLQFEIIGLSSTLAGSVVSKTGDFIKKPGRFFLQGEKLQERIVIRRKFLL